MTATAPSTMPDVLDAAADYIEQNGWTQNRSRNADGAVCAIGAIRYASGQYVPISRLGLAAVDAVESHLGRWICGWNDTPGRTRTEVVAKLREVAAAERGATA
jgi:hypothetical protein